MTEVKIPLTAHRGPSGTGTYFDSFTKAQLKQYGDDRAREALELAAVLAGETVCDTHIPTGVKIYGTRAGKAIRALKDSIK